MFASIIKVRFTFDNAQPCASLKLMSQHLTKEVIMGYGNDSHILVSYSP